MCILFACGKTWKDCKCNHDVWRRLLLSVGGFACKVKDVHSYTTTDAYVITNVAYVSTFNLDCPSGKNDHVTLFAEIPSLKKSLPVTKSLDGKKYQVSWTEEVARAPTGESIVHLYDEKSYEAVKNSKEVTPLASVTINHPGTYKGPIVPIEFLAVAIIVVIGFSAFSKKSQLTA